MKNASKQTAFKKIILQGLIEIIEKKLYKVLAILPPVDPDMETIFQPSFLFVDYLTAIFSNLSFWFGFSPYGFLMAFKIKRRVDDQPDENVNQNNDLYHVVENLELKSSLMDKQLREMRSILRVHQLLLAIYQR